jgi:membrane carboxypeptidase/penicillin-binding protein PbpC
MLDDGIRLNPRAILSIEEAPGISATRPVKTIFSAPEPVPGPQIIDAQTAWLVTDILDDDVARLPAFGGNSALSLPFAAAAKTGTTTDWRDNWTLGYSTERVVGVWVGNADNTPMLDVSGIDGAGPIWRDLMRAAHTTAPPPFTRPPGIVDVTICAPSGMLATADCPRTRVEHFRSGSEPAEADTQFQRIAVDRATGLRATDETPANRVSERVFWTLPLAYRDWMVAQGIALAPPAVAAQQVQAQPAPPLALTITPSNARAESLVLRDPTANTVYRIHPGAARDSQRIPVSALVADGAQWAELRLVAIGPAGRIVIVESSDSAQINGWWQLQVGEWRFHVEGSRAAGAPVEQSDNALVVVEEYGAGAPAVAQSEAVPVP